VLQLFVDVDAGAGVDFVGTELVSGVVVVAAVEGLLLSVLNAWLLSGVSRFTAASLVCISIGRAIMPPAIIIMTKALCKSKVCDASFLASDLYRKFTAIAYS
jgi:hypothetical protein